MLSLHARFDNLGFDGKPCRLGLMGGTFDPIHVGHLAVADQARVELGLDAVLFIPTGKPAFKQDRPITPASIRLEMCRRAVEGNLFFDVCPLEVKRQGITYTIDTLEQLYEHYPDNVSFYFITGTDTAAGIGSWYRGSEIAELAHLVVATRPGYPLDEKTLDAIKAAGAFDVCSLEVTLLVVSSSMLRKRIAAQHSVRYLVPDNVLAYINEQRLYQLPSSSSEGLDPADTLSESFFAARKADLSQRLSTKRFHHVLGVAKTAENLARIYDSDVPAARIAGLLHDWDKNYNDEEIRARALSLGVEVDPVIFDTMPQLLHSVTAAKVLQNTYPALPKEILQAIARHTAGAVRMSDLDMIVYIADVLEPSRPYKGLNRLRKLIGEVSLEELFFKTFTWVFTNLASRCKTMHPQTLEVWNYYAARFRARQRDEKKSRPKDEKE